MDTPDERLYKVVNKTGKSAWLFLSNQLAWIKIENTSTGCEQAGLWEDLPEPYCAKILSDRRNVNIARRYCLIHVVTIGVSSSALSIHSGNGSIEHPRSVEIRKNYVITK